MANNISDNEIKKPNSRVEWAKWLIDHGISIFPIDPETKKPVIKEWQKYSTTPLTDEEKKQYLEMIEKGYNYAVPGGQRGLVILDFEDKELLKAWVGEDELNKLCKNTLCVDTPHGGLHVYLIADDIPEHKFNPVFVREGKGIADLQSFNSYVVGPESCINHKHCNTDKCPWRGQDYTTCYIPLNNNEISRVDLKGLLKFLAEKGKKLGIELSSSARAWIEGEKEEVTHELKEFEELKKELIKHDNGKTIEKVKEEICNKTPPEMIKEVICEGKSYADIGIDRSRGDWRIIFYLLTHGVADPDKILQLLPSDSKAKENEKWNAEKYFYITLKKAWERAKEYIRLKKNLVRAEKVSEIKAEVQETVSEIILKKYKIKTFYQISGDSDSIIGIFKWNKKHGVYEPYETRLRKLVRREIELLQSMIVSDSEKEKKKVKMVKVLSSVVDSIVDEIRDITLTLLPKAPLRIAFPNVTLEWVDSKPNLIFDRDESKFAFHYIPHKIKVEELIKANEIARGKGEISIEDIENLARNVCPKSLEAFKQWVGDKWITLFEIIGYTLYPDIKFKKAFMLLGDTDAGKTTFIKLMEDILGDDNNYSAVPTRELFDPNNRFSTFNLFRKLANVTSETKKYSIDDIDRFKRITGGDPVTADVKFKKPVTFTPYAKLIIASNKLPRVRDTNDKAFWRRWLIVEFPNKFPNDDEWYKKTFTEEELEGILTVSIMAITRVFMQKHFDYEQTPEQIMGLWLANIDTVYKFIKTYTEKGILTVDPRNGDLWVKRTDLYNLYKEFCLDQGFRGVGKKSFARRLREYFGITTDKKNIDGQRVRAFVGIAIDELEKARAEQKYENLLDEFINYVKNNNGVIKEFWEIVQDFGDQGKANRFVTWCLQKNFCSQRGINAYEIHA
ncbi:phage/plasmid primase, P4 family [Sulfurisphaera ohwakuensis]|uniref:DNA primase n=1 Tax=Sulfurisphaera ohwakuensis TaxID=69656 RepID=A0A650CJG4_SULOH|nr:phage/plasmid primase, P4 family [Sulfurisphaera ohwakuensis]QGR17815.1 DNA primase [Sulfurisphaera ohwakuensis]